MPIYAEHRPLYKVAQILLVLEFASRGGKSSILKLQLFNWALKEKSRLKELEMAAETGKLNISVWGIDPTLNAAIQFAISEGLIKQEASNVLITGKGKDYIDSVVKENILPTERTFYTKIKKKITEGMISEVANSWG
jgi:hypothetical protein